MRRELPKLKDNERKALFELKKRLKEKFGDKLKKIILYGSKARGDSEPYSDIDVLIELSESSEEAKPGVISLKDGSRIELPQVREEAKSAISHTAFEVGLEYDVLIICTVYSTGRLEMRKKLWMPFFENVIRDGVLI